MSPPEVDATIFHHRTREDAERWEREHLAFAACRAVDSVGREQPEEPDPRRTGFECDRDRILHSKAFRRLKHKTQVFINPEGDHFVTRLTHTLQVTQIGRSLARYLGLNESLTEAICLGHDVGHSPFGHIGEEALSEFVDGEWFHAAQSARIFRVLEPLNLTAEVLDGIETHPWMVEDGPVTHEGALVRFADRIAYLAHDAEDAIRARVLKPQDFPTEAVVAFGEPGGPWIATMIDDVVAASLHAGRVSMSEDRLDLMNRLRAFMFERVYLRPAMEPQRRRAKEIVRDLVGYYLRHVEDLPATYRHEGDPLTTQVIDYVAGMTDRYAIATHDRLFRPGLFD